MLNSVLGMQFARMWLVFFGAMLVTVGSVTGELNVEAKHPNLAVARLLDSIHAALDAPENKLPRRIITTEDMAADIKTADQLLAKREFEKLDSFLTKRENESLYEPDGGLAYVKLAGHWSGKQNVKGWIESTASEHSYIAGAYLSKILAWKARGSGFISTVSEKGIESFSEHIYQAENHCDAAWQIDPSNPALHKISMTVALGTGLSEAELEEIKKRSLEREVPGVSAAWSIAYFLTPRWHGGFEELSDFVRDELPKWPDSPKKYFILADALDWARKWSRGGRGLSHESVKKAVDHLLAKHAKLYPHDSRRLALKIVNTYWWDESYKACEELCGRLNKQYPNNPGFLAIQGSCLFKQKKYGKAEALLAESVRLGNVRTVTRIRLARSYVENGKFDESDKLAKVLLSELPPDDGVNLSQCYRLLSKKFSAVEDYQSALPLVKKAVEHSPSSKHAWHELGAVHMVLGQKKEAKNCFQKASKDFPKMKEWLDYRYPFASTFGVTS